MTAWKMSIGFCAGMLLAGSVTATDWPQWRGPDRDGVSKEKGILADWSQPPKKLWQITTPGAGYNGPAVAGGVVYIVGSSGKGKDRVGTLSALKVSDGSKLWQYDYGQEWGGGYEFARSTPTVADGRVYLVSGVGNVICVKTADGQKVWSVDTLERFKAKNIMWGIAESPLLVGKLLICHPGGPDAAVVALDAATGETVWVTKGLSDASAYHSPALVTLDGRRQIVTQTAENVVGLDPETGTVLWKFAHKNKYAVHPNTVIVVAPNQVVVSSGYGYGTECLQVSGSDVKRVWLDKEVDCHFQGMLLLDGKLYLTSSKGELYTLEPATGKVLSKLPGVGKAALINTEAGMVAYSESGKILLIQRKDDACQVAGSFSVDFGQQQHWSQPVLSGGVLYVRHGDSLGAFDLKAKP